MQIHELNTLDRLPKPTDYLAIDTGFDTAKIPANDLFASDEILAQIINEWLDNHPEATTTVEDGSLTYKKLVNGTLGFVTPEMFGAIGDGNSDDTAAFLAAVAFAKTNGCVLTSKESSYFIVGDLTLDGIVLFNFGTIKGNGTITITNKAIVEYGSFDGFDIVCDGYYSKLNNCSICNFSSIGLDIVSSAGDYTNVKKGNDAFHDLLIINESVTGNGKTGISIDVADQYIRNAMVINCQTAYVINSSNETLDGCYAWINNNTTFEGSIFCKINQTDFRILGCTSDSYQKCFNVGSLLSGIINDFNFLNNNAIFHDKTFTFIDTFSKIYGTAVMRLTGFAANNNVINVGHYCRMSFNTIDGDFTDFPALQNSSNIGSALGATFNSDARINIADGNLEMNFVGTFSTANRLSTNERVSLQIPDKGKLNFTAYCPAIYQDSSNNQYEGFVKVKCSSAWSHEIEISKIIYDESHHYAVKQYCVNLSVPYDPI